MLEGVWLQSIGHGGQSLSTHISETWNAALTRLIGSHSVKTGADYRRIRLQDFPAISGSFTYTKGYTQLNATTVSTTGGVALASFLLGLPSSASYTVDTTIGNINFGKITSVGAFRRSSQLQARLAF